jgi:transposase InsO family protein
LVHHSDRGSQYLSIKYTERLAEAEIDLSVGTVGDAYDNALAECVIGLFKTEVINQIGPWKSMREVEWETSNGSIGITTADFLAPSDTSRPQKQRRRSMQT